MENRSVISLRAVNAVIVYDPCHASMAHVGLRVCTCAVRSTLSPAVINCTRYLFYPFTIYF